MNPAPILTAIGVTSLQAAVLVGLILAAQRLFRRQLAPRWRAALWLLLVARLMLPVSVGSVISIFNLMRWTPPLQRIPPAITPTPRFDRDHAVGIQRSAGDIRFVEQRARIAERESVSLASGAGPSSFQWLRVSWREAVVVIWFAGFGLILASLGWRTARLSRQLRRGRVCTDAAVTRLLVECADRIGVSRCPVVVEHRSVDGPALFGVLRPRLLMPAGFRRKFSAEELRFIFLHELGHLARRDLPLHALISILQALHWFNPVVWLGFARWRADRELACDALALEVLGPGRKVEYGETVLRLLQSVAPGPGAPVLIGISEDKRQLRQRIISIAGFQPASRWSLAAVALLAALGVVGLTDSRAQKSAPPLAAASAPSHATVAAAAADTEPLALAIRNAKPFILLGQDVADDTTIVGRRVFDGLPFEIAGSSVFGGESARRLGIRLSDRSEVIPVNRAFEELHVIHYAKYSADRDGTRIAVIHLTYVDKTTAELPVIYGEHVRDWIRMPVEGDEIYDPATTAVIWRSSPIESISGGTLRLFETTFRNPHPEIPVRSLEVLAANAQSAYGLVAVTVANAAPGQPRTPSVPLHEARPRTATTFALHAVDAAGRPIAGAMVLVSPSRYLEWQKALITNSAGDAIWTYPATHASVWTATLLPADRPPMVASWNEALPQQVTLRTPATTSIGGVVLDEEHRPVAGIEIRGEAFLTSAPGTPEVLLSALSTHTDDRGRWTLTGVPPNGSRVGLVINDSRYPLTRFVTDAAEFQPAGAIVIRASDLYAGKVELHVFTELACEGTVTDPAGHAIINARIAARATGQRAVAAKTGHQGRFRLRHLVPGEYAVAISADGFSSEFRELTVAGPMPALAITLQPANGGLRGTVTDQAGKPVAGARVAFAGVSDAEPPVLIYAGNELHFSTVTGADGAFAWASPPRAAVSFTVQKPGYLETRESVDLRRQSDVKLILTSALQVSGAVVDNSTGKPVSRFDIVPGSSLPNWPDPFWQNLGRKGFATGDGTYRFDFTAQLEPSARLVFKIIADGYVPMISRPFLPDETNPVFDIRLKPAAPLDVVIVTPDGKPVAGAVARGIPTEIGRRSVFTLQGAKLIGSSDIGDLVADNEGRIVLQPWDSDYKVFVSCPAGFAEASRYELQKNPRMVVQPWARVEGIWRNQGRPVTNQSLQFSLGRPGEIQGGIQSAPAATDASGHFSFRFVPAGAIRLDSVEIRGLTRAIAHLDSVAVAAGETKTLTIDTQFVPARGRLVVDSAVDHPVAFKNVFVTLMPDIAPPSPPSSADTMEKIRAWQMAFVQSDEGRRLADRQRESVLLLVDSDGNFNRSLVPPGKYILGAQFVSRAGASDLIAESFAVNVPAGDTRAVVELGNLRIRQKKVLRVGDRAPDFAVPGLDGGEVKLAALRGKYVLVDFWATWCGPCVAETPYLKAAYDAFGSDERFAMVSLSLDDSAAPARAFARERGMRWSQGFLGAWSKDNVTKTYSVDAIPAVFLLGPDGRIVAEELRGTAIKAAVAAALR